MKSDFRFSISEFRFNGNRRRNIFLAPGIILGAAGLAFGLAACKPKESAYQASEAVVGFAKGMGDGAERLRVSTGEKLGLIEKKYDYVGLAYGPGETPANISVAYTLEEERAIGQALAAELFVRFGRYENERLERYLNLMAAAVGAFSDRPGLPYTVALLQSEEIHSYALPGGYLFVTLGALRICESESELAGLLASGVSHIRLRHTLAQWERLRKDLVPKAQAAPGTQVSEQEFKVLMEASTANLIQHAFTAAEVRSSDREATDILVRLGYEPGGLKAFLTRTQVHLRERAEGRPIKDIDVYRMRDQSIDERLAELHAPELGASLGDRYRRECRARMPAPR